MHAVVVDHALRPGSDRAAATALSVAGKLGASAEIVRLTWEVPATGQAAWRAARLRALISVARRLGTDAIALGHTADDQAETVWLRLGAGTGWRGLAGMGVRSPVPLWPEGRGLWLYRPLLGRSRAELRAELQEQGLTWQEDPANQDLRFARVRARAALAADPTLRLALLRTAASAAALAATLDRAALRAVQAWVQCSGESISFPETLLHQLAPAVLARVLAAGLAAAGAGQRVPNEDLARQALQRLAAEERAFTMAGAKLERRGGQVWLSRDPGGVRGRGGRPGLAPLDLPAGQSIVWDGRALLRAEAAGWRAAPDRRGLLQLWRPDVQPGAAVQVDWLLRERMDDILWRGRSETHHQADFASVHRAVPHLC